MISVKKLRLEPKSKLHAFFKSFNTNVYLIGDQLRSFSLQSELTSPEFRFDYLHPASSYNDENERNDASPIFIDLKKDSNIYIWACNPDFFKDEFSASHVGLFIMSEKPYSEILKHFKKYSYMENEQGTPVFFRFYDSRIFPKYMKSLDSKQKKKDDFWLVDENMKLFYMDVEKNLFICQQKNKSDTVLTYPLTKCLR